MEISEDSQELSSEVKKELAEARAEIKTGRFHTHAAVKSALGLSDLEDLQLEWVQPGRDGRKGYFRRIPRTRKEPTIAQAEARLRFSEIATGTYGMRGTVETDRRRIPENAAIIGKETLGSSYLTEQEREFEKLGKWEKIFLLLSRT